MEGWGVKIVTKLSSFGKEEYPQGEVNTSTDDIHLCSTPTTPAFSHPSFLKEGNLVTTDF